MMTISEELLDKMVDALSRLPYRDVQHIFHQMALEIAPKEEEKKIIHPH